MIKRYRKIAATVFASAVLSSASYAFSAEAADVETVQAVGQSVPELSCSYKSEAYGYQILCPNHLSESFLPVRCLKIAQVRF